VNHWIPFSIEHDKPRQVDDLAAAVLDAVPALARVAGSDDGLKRLDLIAALAPVARVNGLSVTTGGSFAASELDLLSADHRIALSVQAGRARTNNGALRAVLAAGAYPEVSWLILLVPERYKGGLTAKPILEDLRLLATTPGVRLDLDAVLLAAF